jgi:hypothetical protein
MSEPDIIAPDFTASTRKRLSGDFTHPDPEQPAKVALSSSAGDIC